MTDLSIQDLKADMDAQLPDDPDSEDGGGEWVRELVDMLDQRGYLDPLIEQSLGVQGPAGSAPVQADGGDPAPEPAGVDLDADAVSQFGKLVIDSVGDVPMSTVVQYAESNPDQVDRLIEQALDQ